MPRDSCYDQTETRNEKVAGPLGLVSNLAAFFVGGKSAVLSERPGDVRTETRGTFASSLGSITLHGCGTGLTLHFQSLSADTPIPLPASDIDKQIAQPWAQSGWTKGIRLRWGLDNAG